MQWTCSSYHWETSERDQSSHCTHRKYIKFILVTLTLVTIKPFSFAISACLSSIHNCFSESFIAYHKSKHSDSKYTLHTQNLKLRLERTIDNRILPPITMASNLGKASNTGSGYKSDEQLRKEGARIAYFDADKQEASSGNQAAMENLQAEGITVADHAKRVLSPQEQAAKDWAKGGKYNP